MSSFYASLAPEPYRVLGVKLKRLTFGHVVLLQRFGCVPITNVMDLATAVQICSRDYKGGLDYVDSLGSRWRRVLNWWFIRRIRRWNIEDAIKAWSDYLEANSQQPEYARSANKSPSKKGAPELSQVRAYLLTRCGYLPDTIMDHYYGQCLWDCGAAVELENGEGIVGDQHRELAKLLDPSYA